ncbi:hypothetical protein Ddye_030099 [Dipteronia dyeriana]|uniref:Uncharacterized protein n=1 Tax=Dipteronia dyeriana TaxID=168575 RepID=A0AAD9TGD4_9ROSI|nr:hypothetical protein Ddye_030099 [Dipteronia dyeriana]
MFTYIDPQPAGSLKMEELLEAFWGFNAEISVSKDENLYLDTQRLETQRLQRIAMVKRIEKTIVIDALMV